MKTLFLALFFAPFLAHAEADKTLTCTGTFVPTKESMTFKLVLSHWSEALGDYTVREAREGIINNMMQPTVDLAGSTWSTCTNEQTMLEEKGSYVYQLDGSRLMIGWGCPGSYLLQVAAVCR